MGIKRYILKKAVKLALMAGLVALAGYAKRKLFEEPEKKPSRKKK